jgi:enterobactin synthetase component F
VERAVLHRGDRDVSRPPHEAEGVLSERFSEGLRLLSSCTAIGWPDLLVLLSGLYLSRVLPQQRIDGRGVTPFWLPFMSRWGSVAAHMPGMLVNILPFDLSTEPGERLDAFLQRNATTLKQQRRHGRYRIEQIASNRGLPKGSRFFFSPLINVLPFDEPVFYGCTVTRQVMSNGEPEGIDLTFRARNDGSAISFGLSADAAMFEALPFCRHVRDLSDFLDRAMAPAALVRPIEELLREPSDQGPVLAGADS